MLKSTHGNKKRIARLLGISRRTMARILGRDPSTVNCEKAGDITRGHPYRVCRAQSHTPARAPHPRKLLNLRLAACHNAADTGLLARPDCRTTRLVLLARMDGTDVTSAYLGFTTKIRHVPALLRNTLPYDLEQNEGETRAVSAPPVVPGVFCGSAQSLATRNQREYHLTCSVDIGLRERN
jgi:hypothetical protein